MRRWFTEDEDEQLTRWYRQCVPVAEIARRLGRPLQSIATRVHRDLKLKQNTKMLKRVDDNLKRNLKRIDADLRLTGMQKMQAKAELGLSLRQIAAQHGVSHETVRKIVYYWMIKKPSEQG